MFKIFVRFTMPIDGITREREWNGLEKWGAHAVRHSGRVALRYMKKKVRKFRHWRKWLELAERFEEVE